MFEVPEMIAEVNVSERRVNVKIAKPVDFITLVNVVKVVKDLYMGVIVCVRAHVRASKITTDVHHLNLPSNYKDLSVANVHRTFTQRLQHLYSSKGQATARKMVTPPPSPGRVWLIAVAMGLVLMALLFAVPLRCTGLERQHGVKPVTLPLVTPPTDLPGEQALLEGGT